MRRISINELATLTDKDRRTIKKHLQPIAPEGDGRYNCALALQTLYVGDSGPTYSEAIRKLAIAREAETRERMIKLKIENDLKCKRVIGAERVLDFLSNIFIAIRCKITSSHLSEAEQNAILNDLVALQDVDL